MEIILTEQFKSELKIILDFYAEKSEQTAINFLEDLFKKIDNTTFMPYRFRKNQILNREDIRELIFKGYVIPFHISTDSIKILSIFKHNLPKI
ncbi:type II toxin-antitoxin system RelE/ParE family toxin [Campylobacter sp. RM16187]|uniref:type II toxin-antitoxin system RelE/ParE family toxin n=1 Tax=Campylobacter sp. RM16187 TaxID=1660063 RepID=UPI0021B5F9EC|nr:type II toxin-antitoxin system RelE/ParE family toxin [Campylobacter sp. RM16187]QKG30320.1 plasmid stabilization protein [Campylobacter sp. RM16187]